MLKVYPYGSGSFYTASFAISSSFATVANRIEYVFTSSNAATVLNPVSGAPAAINTCLITYDDYLNLLNAGKYEVCNF